MGGRSTTVVEKELARIAGVAHGVVTRAQLLDIGVTSRQIDRRLRNGLLLPEHPGVYRVGHRAPSIEARYMAAVLACGDGALLSGRGAAHLLGLLRGPAPQPEVTTRTKRHVTGVKTRESRGITLADAIMWRGIPATSVPRTLVDLAACLGTDDLARACHEAGVRHRTTPAMVENVLARRSNIPGAAKLREILYGDVRVTLSRARQLPLPLFAIRVGAGPAPGARGPRPRRRLSPLHVRGRLRAPALHAGGAGCPTAECGVSGHSAFRRRMSIALTVA
jgi:hypothetical protein